LEIFHEEHCYEIIISREAVKWDCNL